MMTKEEALAYGQKILDQLAPRSVDEIIAANIATMKALSPETLLAQKILRWIDETRERLEHDGKPVPTTRYSVLIDDIEQLCKEQLKEQ